MGLRYGQSCSFWASLSSAGSKWIIAMYLPSNVSGLRARRCLRRSSKPINPILKMGKLKQREGRSEVASLSYDFWNAGQVHFE